MSLLIKQKLKRCVAPFLTLTMASLVCAMSDMTPSVMMRRIKYWEPSCTAAAYLFTQTEGKKASKINVGPRLLLELQSKKSSIQSQSSDKKNKIKTKKGRSQVLNLIQYHGPCHCSPNLHSTPVLSPAQCNTQLLYSVWFIDKQPLKKSFSAWLHLFKRCIMGYNSGIQQQLMFDSV